MSPICIRRDHAWLVRSFAITARLNCVYIRDVSPDLLGLQSHCVFMDPLFMVMARACGNTFLSLYLNCRNLYKSVISLFYLTSNISFLVWDRNCQFFYGILSFIIDIKTFEKCNILSKIKKQKTANEIIIF